MKFVMAILAVYGSAAFVAYCLIAHGHWVTGALVFIVASMVSIKTKH